MRMHLLSGGRLRMRRDLYYPDASREEHMDIPVLCALLRHPQGNVLFDTGCHPDAASSGEQRWGGLVKLMRPIFTVQDTIVHQLPQAGLTAGDIDVVVCSHLHPDHCGCNGFFPRATVVCHAEELAAARSPQAAALGILAADWDHGQVHETIDAARDLFGDGRITLLPAPGHTRGSLIAHVALDRDGTFVLAADAAPVAAVLEQRYAPRNSWDAAQVLCTLEEIARLQRDGATVIHGHDDSQWQAARRGASCYQ